MFKIGMSSCGFEINGENLYAMKKSGIDNLEISLKSERYPCFDYKGTRALADKYGITLWSFHLPFLPFSELEISTSDNALRSASVKYLCELIKKGSDIGIDKFIVHPSGEPIAKEEREERIKLSMDSLNTLAECAAACGSAVCVEDLPRTCLSSNIEDMKKLLSANEKLKVCFDVNHLLIDKHTDFISAFADKIVTTHISDYDFIDERHWLPAEGLIGWNELYLALKESGFDGVWMYELGFDEPKTLKRTRVLTFDDFYNNAHAIFNGDKPENFRVG